MNKDNIRALKIIKIGFLELTGNLYTLTFSFLINFNNSPPEVIMYDPHSFSDK